MTVGLLALLASRLPPDAVLEAVRGAHPGWLLLAAALGPVQVLLASERWRLTSERVAQPLQRWEAWREYALSTLLNQVLPGGVAGDAARVARQRRAGWRAALGAAIVERGTGQAVLAVVTTAGLLFWTERPSGSLVVAGVVLALFASTLLVYEVRRALAGAVARNLVLSVALVGSFLLAFALCGRALGRDFGVELFVAVPLILLAMAIPLSVGGWGIREASAAAILPAFGWTAEQAVALAACYGISVLVGALPGALVPVWRRRA